MTDQPSAPPYVQPAMPVAVEVQADDGSWCRGFALAWWGQKVTARWTVGVGESYQQTVPADRVRRVDPQPVHNSPA